MTLIMQSVSNISVKNTVNTHSRQELVPVKDAAYDTGPFFRIHMH